MAALRAAGAARRPRPARCGCRPRRASSAGASTARASLAVGEGLEGRRRRAGSPARSAAGRRWCARGRRAPRRAASSRRRRSRPANSAANPTPTTPARNASLADPLDGGDAAVLVPEDELHEPLAGREVARPRAAAERGARTGSASCGSRIALNLPAAHAHGLLAEVGGDAGDAEDLVVAARRARCARCAPFAAPIGGTTGLKPKTIRS